MGINELYINIFIQNKIWLLEILIQEHNFILEERVCWLLSSNQQLPTSNNAELVSLCTKLHFQDAYILLVQYQIYK